MNSRLLIGLPGIGKTVTMKALLVKEIVNTNKRILIVEGEDDYDEFCSNFDIKKIKYDNLNNKYKNNRLFMFNHKPFNYSSVYPDGELEPIDYEKRYKVMMNCIFKFINNNNIDVLYLDSYYLIRVVIKYEKYLLEDIFRDKKIVATIDEDWRYLESLVKIFNKFLFFEMCPDAKIYNIITNNKIEDTLRLPRGAYINENGIINKVKIINQEECKYEMKKLGDLNGNKNN